MTEKACVSITQEGGATTIHGGGTLDLTNCREFVEKLKDASLTADSVTVDFSTADFIDTQIVQDLAKGAVTLLNRGKRLKIVASDGSYPVRVLKISGFQAILDIEIRPTTRQT